MTIETETDPRLTERRSHALAQAAKMICSAIYVGKRDASGVVEADLVPHFDAYNAPFDWDRFSFEIDEATQTVTTRYGDQSRRARCHASQGCLILAEDSDDIFFTPLDVKPEVPDPATTHWPAGDVIDGGQLPANVDGAALEAALDWIFDDANHPAPIRTRAVLVVHQGQIVAERYAPGFGQDTRQVSWSMGKSITAALVGLLVGDGALELDAPAPVAEWSGADDPRREITVRHLLNMSSGLEVIRAKADNRPDLAWTSGDDHMLFYTDAINVFEHAVSFPLGSPPNTHWAYRNCDPMTLNKIVRETVEARGEEYLSFPQRALFDRISMGAVTLETDRWGNAINIGYDYLTPRDWGRFGLLHLHDGVWQPTGERILPEGWVDFVRTPAPADPGKHYGGLFWLNAGGMWPDVPRDAYAPRGSRGQFATIIPSKDTIVVHMGLCVAEPFDPFLNRIVGRILQAIG